MFVWVNRISNVHLISDMTTQILTKNSSKEIQMDQNESDERSGDGAFSLLLGGSSHLVSGLITMVRKSPK